jgi:hypothetical protein
MEEFIEIKGYEGIYSVSNLGNVKRITSNKLLKLTTFKNGYNYVSLSKEGKVTKYTIHGLVANSFLCHINDGTNKLVIDHINAVKTDNNVLNLQLVTNRINCCKDKDKSNCTSKYIGVRLNKGKFEANIRLKGTRKYIGRFDNEIDAYNAYKFELNKINELN